MKDWKGNKIKVGDIVSIYQYNNPFAGSEITMYHLTSDGFEADKCSVSKFPDEYQWTLLSRHIIIDGTMVIMENRTIEATEIQETPYCWADFIINEQPGYAICIEGLSDNQEEFMLNYFDNN